MQSSTTPDPGHHMCPQGAEVTRQLQVNGKLRHLRYCTLEDKTLALERKHRVHKYVNTEAIDIICHDFTHTHIQ